MKKWATVTAMIARPASVAVAQPTHMICLRRWTTRSFSSKGTLPRIGNWVYKRASFKFLREVSLISRTATRIKPTSKPTAAPMGTICSRFGLAGLSGSDALLRQVALTNQIHILFLAGGDQSQPVFISGQSITNALNLFFDIAFLDLVCLQFRFNLLHGGAGFEQLARNPRVSDRIAHRLFGIVLSLLL